MKPISNVWLSPIARQITGNPPLGVALSSIRRPSIGPTDILAQYYGGRRLGIRTFSFYNDVGLGPNSSKTDKYCVKHKLSTDSPGPIMLMVQNAEEYSKQIEEYKAAFKKVNGTEPILHSTYANNPWDSLKQADRSMLDKADVPYAKYYQQALKTAFERGGEAHFYLGGGFDVAQYAADIIKTEHQEKTTFAEFAGTVDYPKLANVAAGLQETDMLLGLVPDDDQLIENQLMPKITSVELYDLVKGSFSDHREKVQYVADNGVYLDTVNFIAAHDDLLDAIGTPENRERMINDRPMTGDAQKAVDRFQKYLLTGELNS